MLLKEFNWLKEGISGFWFLSVILGWFGLMLHAVHVRFLRVFVNLYFGSYGWYMLFMGDFFCLCYGLKGALKRQGRHLKQLNFFQSLNDVIVTSTAYTSCFCFLNGKSSGQDKGDEASSPQGASRNNFFLRGRCTSTLLVVNVLWVPLSYF